MDQNDWKRKLNRMLDTLDEQLDEIDESLQASGISFNEEFQQNVTKMTTLRLESIFVKIQMKRWGTRQSAINSNASARIRSAFKTEPDDSDASSVEVIESESANDLIEIVDSEDEYGGQQKVKIFGTTNSKEAPMNESAIRTDTHDSNASVAMQIFVRGLSNDFYVLQVKPTDIVEIVKEKLEKKTGIPADQQRLFYQGKILRDGHMLSTYNIQKESTVQLNLRVCGC